MQSLILAAILALPGAAIASEADAPVAVVIGPDAPPLEQYAANELCGYLSKLFNLEAKPTRSVPDTAKAVFLIGNPASNPLSTNAAFSGLTDQGIVLKPSSASGKPALIIGGGSSKAVLWAVYELAERWGVRFLLHGDVLPAPSRFEFPKVDARIEPGLRVRQWRVINELAMGPVSWGIADYRPVLDQLAKLKFNRLLIYIWPAQPFLPLEYKGVRQTSGTLFFGNHFPITDDMIGRSLFGSEKEYWNPDLPPPGDSENLTRAGVVHVKALIASAHARGMECVISAGLTEFPREFTPLLEHTHPVNMRGTPTVSPGPEADPSDPVLAGLARVVLDTTLKTYPDADYLLLDLPEHREWTGKYQQAWNALDARRGINSVRSLDSILAAARARTNYPGGAERALTEVKADVIALNFIDSVLATEPSGSARPKIILTSVAEELFPILPRVLPAGSETLAFVDYTPSRIVRRREVLKGIPAREFPATLIYTLHDDNVGVLPQLATGSLHELTKEIRSQGWAGFSTRYWLIGDHDPCVTYLARASWNSDTKPEAVYRDLLTHVCGEAAVPGMLKVFAEVEAATVSLEWHGLGFTFAQPNMLMKNWSGKNLSPELKSVAVNYQRALEAAREALKKTTPSGRRYVEYWMGRLAFGIAYFEAAEMLHDAARAEAAKNIPLAIQHGSRALDVFKQALTDYAGVAGDRSDKGAIAVLNEFGYRPLKQKIASLESLAKGENIGQSANKKPAAAAPEPAVKAVDFQSSKIYQSRQHPSYTSWVSFFPGERGKWYIGCEEVTSPEQPQARASKDFIYGMGLPRGYDQSKYLKELVLLESDDGLKTWKPFSRQTVKASGGSFAQARMKDGRFLRFVWAGYSTDPVDKPTDIFYQSRDTGRSWKKMPPFVSDKFVWYPHRLRTLRDGTLVLCAPHAPKWGPGTEKPTRASVKLDAVNDMQMTLFFSFDQGKTWTGPVPILEGQHVSETDFVELPDGNLLFVNNSIFSNAGRQYVYRQGRQFTPGPLERAHSGRVPETVCLAGDDLLIGCMRAGAYYWSDDLGLNWQTLEGVKRTMEVYQPWMQYLGNGTVACAGHLGADDQIGSRDQYVSLHTFKVQVLRRTARTKLWIERGYEEETKSFLNSFTVTLSTVMPASASSGPAPTPVALPDKDVQIWYVARDAPGYDSWNKQPLADRMKLGGHALTVRTGADGTAAFALPEFNGITNIHSTYQLVVRFNPDNQYPDFKPAQLPQLEYYANNGLDP